jgi:hypothetical protein
MYTIDEDGNIFSPWCKKYRPLNHTEKDGYKTVSLWGGKGTKRKRYYVHRLLAEQYIPNPENKPWVNHKDGNKSNNRIDNLEWSTISENLQHAYNTGLKLVPSGKDNWNTGKHPSKKVRKIMSEKKKGVNHPKFKGWYVTPYGTFASAREAEFQTGIGQRNIIRWCKIGERGYSFLEK